MRKLGCTLGFLFILVIGAGHAWAVDYTITTTLAPTSVYEDAGNVTFTVSIDTLPVAGETVTVPYVTNDGTANGGYDYTAITGVLEFTSSSALSQNIVIPILNDSMEEADEAFTIYIGPVAISPTGNSVTLSGVSTANITIPGNDHAYTLSSTLAATSVDEDAGNVTFTVSINTLPVAGETVTVPYATTDSTAIAGSDYTTTAGTLEFTSSSALSMDIVIPITNDVARETPATEGFVLAIGPVAIASSGGSTATLSGASSATVTIRDNDYEINISPDFSVEVGTGTAAVQVMVSPALASGEQIAVDYMTADGTASAGTDFTTTSGTLTFNHSSSNPQSISIPILNDGVQTGAESFTLNLGNIAPSAGDGATFIDSSCQITINDHDFKITAGLDRTLAEDGGSMVFTVTLNRSPVGSEVVTVNYATVTGTASAGSDFTVTSGTLTFNAGTGNTQTVNVPIINDNVRELLEQFTLSLSGASSNALITDSDAIGTITDNDYTVTAFADISVNESAGTAVLTVTLDHSVAASDSVGFNVSATPGSGPTGALGGGVDYTAPLGTLTISALNSSGTISIPINNDSLVEFAETFTVTITPNTPNVVATDPTAQVTINIDDKYQVSINDSSMLEADAPMAFTVSISPALQVEHDGLQIHFDSADGTATAPADYTAISSGTVAFPTGATSNTLSVTIKDDIIDEGASENFSVTLTGSSSNSIVNLSDPTGLGTILDTEYVITPSWNLHGTVSMESPLGTSIAISSGANIAIQNNEQAKFTVTADYRIHSVLIDGVAPGTLGYISSTVTDTKNHTYTFEPTTPQGLHTIAVLFDHQITMIATGSGTVTHTTGTLGSIHSGTDTVIANHAGVESFRIDADSTQCVTDLLIDDSSVGAFASASDNWDGNTYTFSSVVDNHKVEGRFETAEITVSIGADDGATSTADDVLIQAEASWRAYVADAAYTPGALIKTGAHNEKFSLPADASCDTQYVVIQFLAVDGWLKPSDIHLNLHNAFHDQIVEGLYDRTSHILTIVATHGVVNRDPEGDSHVVANQYIYPADSSVALTAISDPSWFFQLWQGDASGSVSPVNVIMNRDRTVEAVFVQGCQDSDHDGYTTADVLGTGCSPSAQIDCNDDDAEIHPGAVEICGDTIDQDCSGADLACAGVDSDDDHDDYTENQGDCNDANPGVHPGLYDDPATVVDEDCYDGPKEVGTEVTCSHPSDTPANAARKPAPPLIMFLLDDSGSMDWEFMTSEGNQLFENKYYIYPVVDIERAYGDTRLDATQRRKWKSQWAGNNRIFFNPGTTYDPWAKWEEVIGAASVRSHEEEYTGVGSFPDTAYAQGYTHADMDRPRLNTHDASTTINAMYHPGDADGTHANYELDMNAEFTRVKAGGGQQVIVTRDASSSGSSTHADAIGLSTNGNLELTVANIYDWYLSNPAFMPAIRFDNSGGSAVYSETGTWYDSGGDSNYEWLNNDRYADASDRSAYWKLNLTAAQAGDYYVYAWVDEFSDRDGNALYTIFSYDGSANLQSQTVRKDQSPTNSSGSPATGARWIRLNNTPIHFIEQSLVDIIVPNAHYFAWVDTNSDGNYWNDTDNDGIKDTGEVEDPNEKYLVTIPGSGYGVGSYSLKYYLFTDVNSNDTVEDGELIEKTGAAIPAALIPKKYDANGIQITDSAQLAYVMRQDFADWFSFYRRRILTAKAAVGLTVADMKQLELGIYTINRTYHEPLVYMAEAESAEKLSYLRTLYNIRPAGSTFLRRGLDEVGRYFQRGDTIGGYADAPDLKTSEGLCAGDSSVFYDARRESDLDTCDDYGGECQRAYVIAMTDGYYNDGYSSTRIGNQDTSSSFSVFRDGASDSLADFSYYYYHTDLDTNLADHVPPKGFDDAVHQHLVSYMVSFGVFGYFNPNQFPDCLPGCDTPGRNGCPQLPDLTLKTWMESGGKAVFTGSPPYTGTCPDWHDSIFEDSPKAIDDLFHASINGRGEFYNAADPAELVASLQGIKQLIEAKVGTAASVSVNSRKIQDDTLLYQTLYDSGDWSGDVLAKCLDTRGQVANCERVTCESGCIANYDSCMAFCTVGDVACENICATARTSCLTTNHCSTYLTCGETKDLCIVGCAGNVSCESACKSGETTCLENSPDVKWSATAKLGMGASETRQIITSQLTVAGTSVSGIPFQLASLPAGMKTVLGTTSTNQGDMLQYLRGSNQYEQRNDTLSIHNYRNRPKSRLGDFINSEPLHYENTVLGIDWVFAGANDGMLHVFDGQTGIELFAYVPNAVFNNLHLLAADTYTDGHKFYVDGYIAVKDLGDKVVLIAGLGKGGKGYFALDLTAAAANIGAIEANAANIVLWEYTDITQVDILGQPLKSNLGYSFSRPQIVKSNDASAPWILVFANGYDSTNARAALYTVGLNSSGIIQWTKMIDTNQGGASPNCNGLSTPAILYPHGDHVDDYAYAGDLLGNMWKFDLGNTDRNQWKIYFNDGTNPQPLFIAKSNAGFKQPITMQPDVTTSCATGKKGFLVAFGTGRLLDADVDAMDMSVQTAYGIWDWSAAWTTSPETKYLGSFMPVSSPPTVACTASCAAELGNISTSGTCIYDCVGNSECEAECQNIYTGCVTNCSLVRNLSNMGAILGDAGSAKYVALLRQTQVWGGGINYNTDGTISEQVYGATNSEAYDEITRVLSANKVDWLQPAEISAFVSDLSKTIKHVGWYFDLPANGERIIRDVSILNHKLIYTTSIPSDSPCESGGISNYFAVDVCTGGRTLTPFFDINNDGVIDGDDYINAGTEANPIWVAPSSIQVEGLAPQPTPVEVDNGMDRLFFPDDGVLPPSGGSFIEGYGKSIQFWHELDWK